MLPSPSLCLSTACLNACSRSSCAPFLIGASLRSCFCPASLQVRQRSSRGGCLRVGRSGRCRHMLSGASWLIFYVIGLDWDRWKCAAARCRRFVAPCVLVTIGCQVVAGFCWNALGNYNMATTQLKLSSMASSLAVIVAIKTVSSGMKLSLADSPFAKLGDASFGIYLCHILVLAILQKLLGSLFLPLWVGTVVLWMATLLFSYIVVTAASRLLPKRVTDLIGFS